MFASTAVLLLLLVWPELDSDHSDNEFTLSSRSQTEQSGFVSYLDGSQSDRSAGFLSLNLYSFGRKSDEYLGNLEARGPDHISWRLDDEDAFVEEGVTDIDGFHTDFLKTGDDSIFSPPTDGDGEALQHQGCDNEMESYDPQSRRRLDLEWDASASNQKLLSGANEKQVPNLDEFQHGSAPQIHHVRRGFSGPPFYRPLKRYGAHINPINSLSTMESLVTMSEDAAVTPLELGPSSKVAIETDSETSTERNATQMETELTAIIPIEPGEPGSDCNDQLAIQMTPILNEREPDTHEGRIVKTSQEWSNPCMKKVDDILDLSSGILASNIGSLLPVSITKDVLKKARVLQQVDTKFIASVSCGILLLIDQHAADERVRLEERRKEVLGGNIAKQISL